MPATKSRTMEELKALTDRSSPTAVRPGASGWVGRRDRLAGDRLGRGHAAAHADADVYDQWVSNEIAFDDRDRCSHRGIRRLRPQRRYVDGGAGRSHRPTSATARRASLLAAEMLHAPPGVVHSDILSRKAQAGRGCRFLLLPGLCGKDLGKPVLGAGTLLQSPRTAGRQRFIECLQTPIAHEVWMAQSGFLTPHKGVNPEAYANDARKQGEILLNATTFRFDGSDLMPARSAPGRSGPAWSIMPAARRQEVAARNPDDLGSLNRQRTVTRHDARR